jgi:hypothetical protein
MVLSDDDDTTACISGSGDVSSSSLVDSSAGSGYDTSLSSSDESPFSGDDDDNENSPNDDPILEEIAFLHAKTTILQRASHILLHHQDYQNLLSLQERSSNNSRSDALWNEAKDFLRYDDDSGNENVPSDSPGVPLAAVVNSISPVNQSGTQSHSNRPVRQRIGSQPHAAPAGTTRSIGSREEAKIDISTVQCITSQQYQNRLCLNSQVQPIRYSDWLDVCSTTNTYEARKSKKRHWTNMENPTSLHRPLPVHPLTLAHAQLYSQATRIHSDSCCKLEETAANIHPFSLLHRSSPMMTMAMEAYEEDGQNSLSSASRENNASVVVGTVG